MTITNITLASWNVRSLGQGIQGVRKRCDIRNFLRRAEPQPDILLFQEHCYPLEDCFQLTQQLQFKGGTSIWNNALFTAEGNRFFAGTGVSLSCPLTERLVSSGVIVEGCAQYLVLDINGLKTGIINVYAPNDTGARARFWSAIADFQLPECHWIMAGDFNMTELSEDRSADYNARNMGHREESAWARLSMLLGIQDVFHSDEYRRLGSKNHTWRRERPHPTWSRIDRFYTSLEIRLKAGRHGIWPHLSHLSDHAPIFLQIPFGRRSAPKHPHFNKALIQDSDAAHSFERSWVDAMQHQGDFSKCTRILTAMEQIRRLSGTISSDRKRKAKTTYNEQFLEVRSAELKLQEDWTDLSAWEQLNAAQAKLEDIRQSKLEATKNANAARWCRVGDRCSKEFFEFHKDPKRKSSITELMDGGRSLTAQKDLEEYILRYYKELYTNDPVVENNVEARNRCLLSVPTLVTESMNRGLLKGFTNNELKKALQDIPSSKAPGHDTIPPELIKELWDTVGDAFTEMLKESLSSGVLDDAIKLGITNLIPKGGTQTLLKNLRPISVLTASYKLIAKTLANRLQPLLPEVILPTQTAFVKDRFILDNVFLAMESIDWALESNQDLVILLLDFEKAYDRVNWTFLEASMEKLGFSREWISWTSALYRDAESVLLVNGKKLPKFKVERSVRQGCPLAPYLYLFISDVLAYMVNDDSYGIVGLRLPDDSLVRIQCFADDTALYLKGTRENMQRAFKVIELFCAASGAKLNWNKSSAIWVSHLPRNWTWGEDMGLVWLDDGVATKYLGFPFGKNLLQKDKDAKILHQVRSKLNFWTGKRLSLAARVLVSNQVILASIWYFASCCAISKGVLLRVRTLVRNFIWGDQPDKRIRARVAWDTAVIPTVKGGLKIFDP